MLAASPGLEGTPLGLARGWERQTKVTNTQVVSGVGRGSSDGHSSSILLLTWDWRPRSQPRLCHRLEGEEAKPSPSPAIWEANPPPDRTHPRTTGTANQHRLCAMCRAQGERQYSVPQELTA